MSGRPSFRTNLAHAVLSNVTVAIVSALSTLVIPKFIGVVEYGYWQLFIFYGSYVLLVQLGASDGANLRYGGMQRSDVASRALGFQALILLLSTWVLSVGLVWLAPLLSDDPDRVSVLRLVALFSGVVNIRHFLVMQMQSVVDFRSYSRVTVGDRLVFVVVIVGLLVVGAPDFRALAAAEIIAKSSSLVLAGILLRDVWMLNFGQARLAMRELAQNVYVGLKLTIANTSNMLILGVSRFLTERVFGVAVFGSVSLVLNLSSFVMVFINAVGFVLFPTLRRMDPNRLPGIYDTIRLPLSFLTLAVLLFSHPIAVGFGAWLPEYGFAMQYIPILLPMIVFEARMGLLVTPYLKALRKENMLLRINLYALGISFALSCLATIYFGDLRLAVLAIVISLAFRVMLAEVLLLRTLGLPIGAMLWADIVLVGFEVVVHVLVGGWLAAGIYGLALLAYGSVMARPLAANFRVLVRTLRGS